MSQIKLISNKALSILKHNNLGLRLKEINNIKDCGEGIGCVSTFFVLLGSILAIVAAPNLTIFSLSGLFMLFFSFIGSAIIGSFLGGSYTSIKKLNSKIDSIKIDIQDVENQFALLHFFEEIYNHMSKETIYSENDIEVFKNNLKSLKDGLASDNKAQSIFSLTNLYYLYTEKVESTFLQSFNLLNEFGNSNYEKAFAIYKDNIANSIDNEEGVEIEKQIGESSQTKGFRF